MCNEHCLVETVAGDLLQEIADQPGGRPAHRLRGLTARSGSEALNDSNLPGSKTGNFAT